MGHRRGRVLLERRVSRLRGRDRGHDRAERENGKAGWLLGASFITEGAIPFAAALRM